MRYVAELVLAFETDPADRDRAMDAILNGAASVGAVERVEVIDVREARLPLRVLGAGGYDS